MSKDLLSDEQLIEMKRLYMDYVSINQIANVMKVSRASIYYHIKKNEWETERDLMKAELFSTLAESKRVDFTKMTQSTIQIITRALEDLATRQVPPSIKEATQASDILATLDKITRLDNGEATDIVSNQEKSISIVEVQKKIAKDPFAEIEYKEEE